MLLFLFEAAAVVTKNSLASAVAAASISSSPSMSSSTTSNLSSSSINIKNKSYMYLINILIITILCLSCFPTTVAGQDFYGASYANNRSPDEVRQRVRTDGFDDPAAAGISQDGHDNDLGDGQPQQQPQRQGCPGPWQWQCDSGHCIAQYDLCDGVTQCPDDSDEKNCRGRFGPSQHISSYRQQPAVAADPDPKKPATKSSTTDAPKTTLHPSAKDSSSILLPLKFVFAGAGAFILVAGLAHLFVKRRNVQATVRNYRKGQSMVDDEDDLLISQMYS